MLITPEMLEAAARAKAETAAAYSAVENEYQAIYKAKSEATRARDIAAADWVSLTGRYVDQFRP